MKATFGAGCFWCIEHVFRKKEIISTTVGYMGGKTVNPTYEDVCTDTTGHAEVVQVEYDPSTITYGEILDIFWNNHDPTTLNRQGPDVGTQYRSAVFCHTLEQENEAKKSKDELEKSGKFSRKIVTEITPAKEFYK
ncbi:MAG: peptide-methionine (S)-S-oxide reductase MsrA, partial [Thaumarchaeota archaeon]|nr:peptide-methionine (S)-S-oxide reductase MsrA [Nitrososphaerota archaeon]